LNGMIDVIKGIEPDTGYGMILNVSEAESAMRESRTRRTKTAPADLAGDQTDDSSREVHAAKKLDDQTFALLKTLQTQGASGLALELISPQLVGISQPSARLKFASILFDMMHIRGRYADAAELIRQELALYPPNAEVHSPLLPLKIRFIHHQMFTAL
jgi:hypothetical protein